MTEPNMSLDIDALFAHMRDNHGQDTPEEQDWHFRFRSDDFPRLEAVAVELGEEFQVHVQEETETITAHGAEMGPPMLVVVIRDTFDVDDVKKLAARFTDLAERKEISYEGVDCFDPVDMDELFGWLELEEAAWRLLHFTDSGLEPNADMPFVFGLVSTDGEALTSASAALQARGYDVERVEEEDQAEEGLFVRCAGRNDGEFLTEKYNEVASVAQDTGVNLLGVQFFDEEEPEDESP